MTDAHKAALAQGRKEGKAVREYLEALRASRPSPGRKRTPDSIARRLAGIDVTLVAADPVQELQLVQERIDLLRELDVMSRKIDLEARERAFVGVAKGYSQRTGTSYRAWRAVGVSAAVLKAAGVDRRM